MYNLVSAPFLGGVNLQDDSRALRRGQVAYAKNLFPVIPGKLSKRRGTRDAGESQVAVTDVVKVVMPTFCDSPSWFPVFNKGGTAQAGFHVTGGATATTWIAPELSERPVYLEFNNIGYLFAGKDALASGWKFTNVGGLLSAEAFTFAGTGNESIRPAGAALYRSRFVYWNLGVGYENHILFADRFTPNTVGDNALAANGRAIQIGTADGDRIVGCIDLMLTGVGSPAQSALLVLKQHSAYLITGEPNQSTDAIAEMFADLVINRISLNCGCIGFDTIVRTPHGVVWASPDDVWMFQGGSLPKPLGYNIRPVLKNSNTHDRAWCYATYWDGTYRLGVKPAITLTRTVSGFDFDVFEARCLEEYWLDLRNGPPPSADEAQWWGPMVYNFLDGQGSDTDLIHTGGLGYVTDQRSPQRVPGLLTFTTHPVHGTYLTSCDVPGQTKDETGYAPTLTTSKTGHEIRAELRLQDIFNVTEDGADPAIQKLVLGVEAVIRTGQPIDPSAYVLLDSGRQRVALSSPPKAGTFMVDVDALTGEASDTQALSNEAHDRILRPAAGVRPLGRSYQLWLVEQDSFIQRLPVGYTDFVFTWNGTQYTADVSGLAQPFATPADDIDAFISELANAMTTAVSPSAIFTGSQTVGGGSDGTVTIQVDSGTWAPVIGGAGTNFLLSILGFGVGTAYSEASSHTGSAIPPKVSSEIDILTLGYRIRPIARRTAK